jgi:CheY-like chemotaxis protein
VAAAKRILVVDDNPGVLEAFGLALESFGAKVTLAAGGGVALQELRRADVALVVLDLNLPDVSGLRVLEWMSANASAVPVLVVTGMEDAPDVLRRFPNLVRIVERKPISNDLLKHLVEVYAGSDE